MKLLKKEYRLCMHPTGYLMPFLSALVLVPGYPYGVCCFYITLVVFFICLGARENHDATYTLMLPVSRRDAVFARVELCALLELVQLLFMGLFILLKYLIGTQDNPAGLDAGVAVVGQGFLIYAIFNMVFFPLYYKDINKPGKAFVVGAVLVFLWIILEIVATYTVKFVQFTLDTEDPLHMREKLLFTLGSLALFVFGTYAAALRSVKKFEPADLAL